jgi:hypothetical protein
MRWDRVGHDVAITASGITERTLEGSTVSEKAFDWTEAHTVPGWIAGTWKPVPKVHAYASSDTAAAVIVGMASLLALGVWTCDGAEWYCISSSPQAAVATTLARFMGVADADNVSACTDPNKVRRSSVLNAIEVSFGVRPLATVAPSSTYHRVLPSTATDALAAWMPNAQVRTPEFGALPNTLRIPIEQRLNIARSHTTLAIGAYVEEMVVADDRQIWRYEARLMPGQTDARRFDSTTGFLLDEGVIDREGHFGPAQAQCPYCGGRTCAVCTDRLVLCDCCTAPICKRCVREPHNDLWVCPAFAALRPPTRSEARQHGRLLSTRHMLIGTDSQHTVAVEYAKHKWSRRNEHGEKRVIASPSVSTFLSERLAATDTPAPTS